MRKASLILLILSLIFSSMPMVCAEDDSTETYEYDEISFQLPASMEKNEEESYTSFILNGNVALNFSIDASIDDLKKQYGGDELDVIVELVGDEDFDRDNLKDAAIEERDGLKLYCFEFDIPVLTNHIAAIYALAPEHTYKFNLVYSMMGLSLKDLNEISACYDLLRDSLKYVGKTQQSGSSGYNAELIAKHIITEDGYFVMRPREFLRKFNDVFSLNGEFMTFVDDGTRCNLYHGKEQMNIFLQFFDPDDGPYPWGSGLDYDRWSVVAINIATDHYTVDEEFLATFSIWLPMITGVLGLDFDSDDFMNHLVNIGSASFPAYAYAKDGLLYSLRAYDASFIYREQTIVYEASVCIPHDVILDSTQGSGQNSSAVTPTVGSSITFGHYEQDNNLKNGQEPIEWLVLDVQDNRALLISKYGLDAKPYHSKKEDVTWETCSLRKWLNSDFLNTAFTAEEQTAILTTSVDNSKSQGNSYWNTSGGKDTTDMIFLLSYEETLKYFGSYEPRRCKATEYAIAKGAFVPVSATFEESEDTCWWWLRSPGLYQSEATGVMTTGNPNVASSVNNSENVARPALWINLKSGIF